MMSLNPKGAGQQFRPRRNQLAPVFASARCLGVRATVLLLLITLNGEQRTQHYAARVMPDS